MVLYFHNKLRELGLTYHQFFDTAYWWQFGRRVSLIADYVDYQLHGTLPEYVLNYLHHLKEQENGNLPVQTVQSRDEDQREAG